MSVRNQQTIIDLNDFPRLNFKCPNCKATLVFSVSEVTDQGYLDKCAVCGESWTQLKGFIEAYENLRRLAARLEVKLLSESTPEKPEPMPAELRSALLKWGNDE